MKTLLPNSIENVEEAKAFLIALCKNGESFHPDDPPHEIEWELPEDQKPTDQELDKLDQLINEIHGLPEVRNNEVDIYGWMLDELNIFN